jgi:hypothetical protein
MTDVHQHQPDGYSRLRMQDYGALNRQLPLGLALLPPLFQQKSIRLSLLEPKDLLLMLQHKLIFWIK